MKPLLHLSIHFSNICNQKGRNLHPAFNITSLPPMSYVRHYLETFHLVTDEQYAQIAPYEKEILTLKKGEYFLKAGEVTNQMGLVIEGVLANNYIDNGQEKIQYFLSKNEVAANPESFDFRTPSKVSIRALSTCHLVVIDHPTYWKLVEILPWWGQLTRTIGSVVLTKRLQKRAELMTMRPTERYEAFSIENPNILQQVPLGMIASYLGIQPPSLSRIRRKQLQRNRSLKEI
ncbi:Crp/Fnr family transcriptional regulator [Runella rosea]|nr:Crp/Fnr family transcriptional regulator [Runella rosea]